MSKYCILDANLMQALPVNEDWEMGLVFDIFSDAQEKADVLALASPLETFTIVQLYATVAVPKSKPPKTTYC